MEMQIKVFPMEKGTPSKERHSVQALEFFKREVQTKVFPMKKWQAEKSIEQKYSKEQVATKAGENLLMAKTEEFLYKKMKNDIQICINLSRFEKHN